MSVLEQENADWDRTSDRRLNSLGVMGESSSRHTRAPLHVSSAVGLQRIRYSGLAYGPARTLHAGRRVGCELMRERKLGCGIASLGCVSWRAKSWG